MTRVNLLLLLLIPLRLLLLLLMLNAPASTPPRLKLTPPLISPVSVAVAVYTVWPEPLFSSSEPAEEPEVIVGATSSRLLIVSDTVSLLEFPAASVAPPTATRPSAEAATTIPFPCFQVRAKEPCWS